MLVLCVTGGSTATGARLVSSRMQRPDPLLSWQATAQFRPAAYLLDAHGTEWPTRTAHGPWLRRLRLLELAGLISHDLSRQQFRERISELLQSGKPLYPPPTASRSRGRRRFSTPTLVWPRDPAWYHDAALFAASLLLFFLSGLLGLAQRLPEEPPDVADVCRGRLVPPDLLLRPTPTVSARFGPRVVSSTQ